MDIVMKIASMVALLLVFSLFSSNLSWAADLLPPNTSLTVEVLPAYSYRADDGKTVVLGEVLNHNNFPITDVKIGVAFLDENDNTIEYKTGSTLLKVVPGNGKAAFSISSTKSDPAITKVQTNVAGFISSSTRQQVLSITPGHLQIASQLSLSGTIKNGGTITSSGTKIYLITYDAFQRVVAISNAEPIDIGPGTTASFSITSTPNSHAKSYKLVAESDNYQSTITNVTDVTAILPVIIGGTLVTDSQGNKYSTIPVGSPVKITSELTYLAQQPNQAYVYYVQVKNFEGTVEFVGNYKGIFLGESDKASVTWNPTVDGPYFIETYVWDSDYIPLASPGNIINVVLVKSQHS
ncbi:MAG TPA: FxLYD domain-containing protein [Nitrosopumilaceae archaeon]|nr:FxLYD domain-containing protein [Nitrosopumilaceae archaeon]